MNDIAKSAATVNIVNDEPATPPRDRHWKFRALLHRRSLWLIGALLVAGAGAFGYHWAFGKAKVHYATAAIERGDVESTVVAAGVPTAAVPGVSAALVLPIDTSR